MSVHNHADMIHLPTHPYEHKCAVFACKYINAAVCTQRPTLQGMQWIPVLTLPSLI